MADVLPGYTWDSSSGRYRNSATGRFVARRDILSLLEGQINDAESRLGELTTAFHEGRISGSVWQEQMRTELRRLHSQNRALAVGGWDRMVFARDWAAVGGRLGGFDGDYGRVARLAGEIAAGEVTLPQALNRVRGYVGNARVQFWEGERQRTQPGEGMALIFLRTLGVAEHCGSCITYHQRGWQLDLPVPGTQSECMTHCKCTMRSREVPMAEVNSWIGTRRN